jgi:hypothetical protein
MRQWTLTFCALALLSSAAKATERVQHFAGVTASQIWQAGCVGLKVKYEGHLSSESDLQVLVNLNGVSGIFKMDRMDGFYQLSAESCPRTSDTRKLFYSAMVNGHPSGWFVHLAFLGEKSEAQDNYGFYFP